MDSCRHFVSLPPPVPGQQLVELVGGMFGDAGQDVGEPGLRIDIVELGRDDQAVHTRRPLAAAIGAAEQTGLAVQGDAAQSAFSRVVRQADPAILKQAGEGWPAGEHVVHGLGDRVMAREPGPLLAHPRLQLGDDRRASLLANSQPLRGGQAIDGALDVEQGVDAPDRLQAMGEITSVLPRDLRRVA